MNMRQSKALFGRGDTAGDEISDESFLHAQDTKATTHYINGPREDAPTLVTTLLEELRARLIVCPSLPAIERLAGSVRARAQRQLWRRARRRTDR
jgi:hypothetical protein